MTNFDQAFTYLLSILIPMYYLSTELILQRTFQIRISINNNRINPKQLTDTLALSIATLSMEKLDFSKAGQQ